MSNLLANTVVRILCSATTFTLFLLMHGPSAHGATNRAGEMAVTIDDPHLEPTPMLLARERDRRIRAILASRGLQAGLFVCGKRVDCAEGKDLLYSWSREGHLRA